MRRRGFSWFVVLLLTGALGATAALAASFAHRTRLDDWALGRFVPPPPDRRAAEAGGPSFSAMTQLAMEEVSAAKWPVHLALRVERVDVRGPWPLSALLQEFFESGAVPGQGCPVLSLVRAGPGGAMEGFGGVAFPRQTPRGFFHSMLPEPFVAGFGAEPVDCRASVVPGAERCLGLASPGPADVIVYYREGPQDPIVHLALGGRGLLMMGYDPMDLGVFYRMRVEAWLPVAELGHLPRRARNAAGMVMLGGPDRDTDGDGLADAYTFHLEAWGEPVDLEGQPNAKLLPAAVRTRLRLRR